MVKFFSKKKEKKNDFLKRKKNFKMSKKARSEGNRVAMAIKANKSPFYISDMDLDDDSADVFVACESVRKTLGKLTSGFLVISAGVKNLIVVADIPEDKELSARDFLLASLSGISETLTEDSTDRLAKAVVEIDTPFKLKDVVRASAFAYLRKNGKVEEESEEEEYYDF